MQTFEAIRTRRAVKHYDPDFTMPDDHEQELKDLLRQSPTSFNLQNWRFVMVKDTDCLLYTSPSPRDQRGSRMPSSA